MLLLKKVFLHVLRDRLVKLDVNLKTAEYKFLVN